MAKSRSKEKNNRYPILNEAGLSIEDLSEIKEMAFLGFKTNDICRRFIIDPTTLANIVSEQGFDSINSFIDKYYVEGNVEIAKLQYQNARRGSDKLACFLGKNRLGQSETPNLTGSKDEYSLEQAMLVLKEIDSLMKKTNN
jgi:hypothetical protein